MNPPDEAFHHDITVNKEEQKRITRTRLCRPVPNSLNLMMKGMSSVKCLRAVCDKQDVHVNKRTD